MKALYLVVIVAVIAIGIVVLYEASNPSNNPVSIPTTTPLIHSSSSYQLNNTTTTFLPKLVPTSKTIILKASEQNMSIKYIETQSYNNESFYIIINK
ncbi:MAG: hypothetical protein F7B59_01330 [Desulfurococcales archaeon]|nr:hypothetical protein [Desulfurococcales archaeon]